MRLCEIVCHPCVEEAQETRCLDSREGLERRECGGRGSSSTSLWSTLEDMSVATRLRFTESSCTNGTVRKHCGAAGRQGKERKGKERQGRARQVQGKDRQGRAREGKASTRQGQARKGKESEGKYMQGQARTDKEMKGNERKGK